MQRKRQTFFGRGPQAGRQTAQDQVLEPCPQTECLAEKLLEGLSDAVGDQLGQNTDQGQARPETEKAAETVVRGTVSHVESVKQRQQQIEDHQGRQIPEMPHGLPEAALLNDTAYDRLGQAHRSESGQVLPLGRPDDHPDTELQYIPEQQEPQQAQKFADRVGPVSRLPVHDKIAGGHKKGGHGESAQIIDHAAGHGILIIEDMESDDGQTG